MTEDGCVDSVDLMHRGTCEEVRDVERNLHSEGDATGMLVGGRTEWLQVRASPNQTVHRVHQGPREAGDGLASNCPDYIVLSNTVTHMTARTGRAVWAAPGATQRRNGTRGSARGSVAVSPGSSLSSERMFAVSNQSQGV